MLEEKVCFKCNTLKSLSEYYKHKGTSDGHLGKCKECTKKDTKERNVINISTPEGLEKERERHRDKYYRLDYKEKHKPTSEKKKEYMDRHRKSYPEKYKAKNLSQVVEVSIKGNQRHHWNYNIEFAKDIIEMNPKEHAKIHRFLIYDEDTFTYKDLEGNPLDTKEKHTAFIESHNLKIYN